MSVVYYSNYTPVSNSVAAVEAQEHFLGRRLLLQGLRNLYHISCQADELDALISFSPNGKPYFSGLPDIHFNISHCDGLVACAFSNHPIGIDAELPGHYEHLLIKKVFSPEEKYFFYKTAVTKQLQTQWFFRFWTLKEAYVKKTGTGITIPLSKLSFTFSGVHMPFSVACSDPNTACWQHTLESGHILSVCYERSESDTILLNPL